MAALSLRVFLLFFVVRMTLLLCFFFVLMGSISFWFKGLNTCDGFAQDQNVNVLCGKGKNKKEKDMKKKWFNNNHNNS